MKVFNPVVGMTYPWYVKFLLLFRPLHWSHDQPIKGFHTTWSIGYKTLFGVVYITDESIQGAERD